MPSVFDVILAISTSSWAPADTTHLSYVFDCPPVEAESQMATFLDFPLVYVSPRSGYVYKTVAETGEDVWSTTDLDGTRLWIRVPTGTAPQFLAL